MAGEWRGDEVEADALAEMHETSDTVELADAIASLLRRARAPLTAENAALRAEVERLRALRRPGAMLANCAYNLAQRGHLTDDERRALEDSWRAWDAATAALAATRPAEDEHG